MQIDRDICDPPREMGREVKICKFFFFSGFDSRVLPVLLTENLPNCTFARGGSQYDFMYIIPMYRRV